MLGRLFLLKFRRLVSPNRPLANKEKTPDSNHNIYAEVKGQCGTHNQLNFEHIWLFASDLGEESKNQNWKGKNQT